MAGLKALVVDYGGVITGSLPDAMAAWCEADGIDLAEFAEVMKQWLGTSYGDEAASNPVHALERGEMTVPDFERELAARLRGPGGSPVEADGLLKRMFAAFRVEQPMVVALRRARAGGYLTALLSNSWGMDYDREQWAELFDQVVVSGEVGLRKPEPEIYRLTAQRLGVQPEQCVFVDDLRPNIRGAVAVGMVGVHHTDPQATLDELETLLGLPLR